MEKLQVKTKNSFANISGERKNKNAIMWFVEARLHERSNRSESVAR